MKLTRRFIWTGPLLAVLPGAPALAASLAIDTVYVGNTGNLPDPLTGNGAVNYGYYIGSTEVTNAQYANFLNAVDPAGSNPNAVYNSNMSSPLPVIKGGIDFNTAAPAGSKYAPKPNFADKPVNYVSFYDAARFANWVMSGNTESGFYSFSGVSSIASQGAHGPGFGGNYVAIASSAEWYKAAYHKNDGDTGNYFLYATGSDTLPTVASATATGDIANPGVNVANYNFGANWNGTDTAEEGAELGNVTTVGSAGAGSASPYGTFDQSGNVLEWTDLSPAAGKREMRGGSLWLDGSYLGANYTTDYLAHLGGSSLGFRLVSLAPITTAPVPVPAAVWLFGSGMAGLVGFGRHRRQGKGISG